MAHKQLMGMWRSEAGGCSRAGDLSTTCKLDEDVALFFFFARKKKDVALLAESFFFDRKQCINISIN